MDLTKLKEHEDHAKSAVDGLPRIEQLIVMQYLNIQHNISRYDLSREIEKEYRKELDR